MEFKSSEKNANPPDVRILPKTPQGGDAPILRVLTAVPARTFNPPLSIANSPARALLQQSASPHSISPSENSELPGEKEFILGKTHWQKNERTNAIQWYKQAINQGSDKALTELEKILRESSDAKEKDDLIDLGKIRIEGKTFLGKPIRKDIAAAFENFNAAYNAKSHRAAFVLGEYYMRGQVVPLDYFKAAKYFNFAIAHESFERYALDNINHCAAGCMKLGMAEKSADSPNYTEVLEMLNLACELGNWEAAFELGTMYRNGDGVKRDFPQSIDYFKLAAKYTGIHIEDTKNHKKALKEIRRSMGKLFLQPTEQPLPAISVLNNGTQYIASNKLSLEQTAQLMQLVNVVSIYEKAYLSSNEMAVIRGYAAFGSMGYVGVHDMFRENGYTNAASTYFHKDFSFLRPASSTGTICIKPKKDSVLKSKNGKALIFAGDGGTKFITEQNLISDKKKQYAGDYHPANETIRLDSIDELHEKTLELLRQNKASYGSKYEYKFNEIVIANTYKNDLKCLFIDSSHATYLHIIRLFLQREMYRAKGLNVPMVELRGSSKPNRKELPLEFVFHPEWEQEDLVSILKKYLPVMEKDKARLILEEVLLSIHGINYLEKDENGVIHYKLRDIVMAKGKQCPNDILNLRKKILSGISDDPQLKLLLDSVDEYVRDEIKRARAVKFAERQKKTGAIAIERYALANQSTSAKFPSLLNKSKKKPEIKFTLTNTTGKPEEFIYTVAPADSKAWRNNDPDGLKPRPQIRSVKEDRMLRQESVQVIQTKIRSHNAAATQMLYNALKEKEDIETAAKALKQGANPNAKFDNFSQTPLNMAVFRGHSKMVKLLLKNGAKIDGLDKMNRSALVIAASHFHKAKTQKEKRQFLKAAQVLQAYGASVETERMEAKNKPYDYALLLLQKSLNEKA